MTRPAAVTHPPEMAELEEVLRLQLLEELAELVVLLALHVGADAERLLADAMLDNVALKDLLGKKW